VARRDDVLGMSGAETLIGSGVTLKGNLKSDGDVVIDGTLTGEIRTLGDVIIGINGILKSNIIAGNVTINGSVTGNISAENEVTIKESGQLHGDVTALGLAIQPGGIFAGTNSIRASSGNSREPEAK
jgi:cytoskeletal protein CcmA (bactofilin family)